MADKAAALKALKRAKALEVLRDAQPAQEAPVRPSPAAEPGTGPSRDLILPPQDRPTPENMAARDLADIEEAQQAALAAERSDFESRRPPVPPYMQSPAMGMNPAAFTPPSRAVEALTGGNPIKAKVALEEGYGGGTASKKSAGLIKAAEEAVPAALTLVGGALGKGGAAAYGAGGLPAVAKYGGAMGAEILAGLVAEKGVRTGAEALGMDPNTASIVSNVTTIPVTAAGMKATAKALLTREGRAAAKKAAMEALLATKPKPAEAAESAVAKAAEDVVAPVKKPSEPIPGVEITAAGTPERVVRKEVPEPAARANRFKQFDKELEETITELSQYPPKDEAGVAAYQARIDYLVAQRARAMADEPPAPLPPGDAPSPGMAKAGTRELSRREAREQARAVEARLMSEQDFLSPAQKAELESRAAELRKYGGQGIEDDVTQAQVESPLFPENLADETPGLLPPERPGLAARSGMSAEAEELGLESVRQAEKLRRQRAMTEGRIRSAERKAAEDFLENTPPELAKQGDAEAVEDFSSVAPKLRALLTDVNNRIAAYEDPAAITPLTQARDLLKARVAELDAMPPAAAKQTSIQSDEPQLLFGENPDITIRPEEPLYRREFSIEEEIAPGTQGVLRPTAETLELNYPDLRSRSERFRTAKAKGEKAVQDIRGLRERLENNPDIDQAARSRIEQKIAKLEKQAAEDPALKEWDKARGALEEDASLMRKSFLDHLAGAGQKAKKAAVPEASHLPAGNTPPHKWLGPKDVAERMSRRESTPLMERQLSQRLESLEAQAADAAARGLPENARLTNAINETRANLFRYQAREQAESATRTLIDRYADNVTDEAAPAAGAAAAKTSQVGGLTDAVRRILYDTDWAFRNMRPPKGAKSPGRAKQVLEDVSGRVKDVRALTVGRTSRSLSRVWVIDRKKKLGMNWMTDEEWVNWYHVLERRAEPMNSHVDLVAAKFREVSAEMADEFSAMGGLTYDRKLKAWRPFAPLLDFVPHITANIRKLAEDEATRARVKENMLLTLGIADAPAEQMINEYVALMLDKSLSQDGVLTRWLVDSGQAGSTLDAYRMLENYAKTTGTPRSSSLEYSRSFNLPFVDPNLKESLPGWFESTWRRMTWIEKFGQEIPSSDKIIGEAGRPMKLADVPDAVENQIYESMSTIGEALKELELAGGKQMSDEAAKRLNAVLNRQTEDQLLAGISRTIRSLSMFRLNYLASENLFQGILGSTLRGDLTSTLKGLRNSFSDEALKLAEQSGSRPVQGLEEATMHPIYFGGEDFSMMEFQKVVNGWMKVTGIKATENYNRTITPSAAMEYINRLYKTIDEAPAPRTIAGWTRDKAQFAKDELARLNLPVNRTPTDEEVLRSLFQFDREVNFEIDPWFRPEWSNSLWGRHVTQFYNWNYQQTRLVYNETYGMLARGVREKNIDALARGMRNTIILTTMYPVAGLTARFLRAMMKTAVGSVGAGGAAMMGARHPQYPEALEDYQAEIDESPGLAYWRSANRLGALPLIGDPVESLWMRGQFPQSPSMYGDLTEDMFMEIFKEPIEVLVKSLGEEMGGRGRYDRPVRKALAEEIEGMLQVGPIPEMTVPLSQPVREAIAGEREKRGR